MLRLPLKHHHLNFCSRSLNNVTRRCQSSKGHPVSTAEEKRGSGTQILVADAEPSSGNILMLVKGTFPEPIFWRQNIVEHPLSDIICQNHHELSPPLTCMHDFTYQVYSPCETCRSYLRGGYHKQLIKYLRRDNWSAFLDLPVILQHVSSLHSFRIL